MGPDADLLVEALAEAVAGVDGVRDAAVAVGDADRKRLWALREAHTEVLAPLRPVKLDVAVPVPALAAFVDRVAGRHGRGGGRRTAGDCSAISPRATCTSTSSTSRPSARTPSPTPSCAWSPRTAGASAPSTASAGPSAAWLHLGRSPADIAAMRAVKDALDPAGLFSPGRVLP